MLTHLPRAKLCYDRALIGQILSPWLIKSAAGPFPILQQPFLPYLEAIYGPTQSSSHRFFFQSSNEPYPFNHQTSAIHQTSHKAKNNRIIKANKLLWSFDGCLHQRSRGEKRHTCTANWSFCHVSLSNVYLVTLMCKYVSLILFKRTSQNTNEAGRRRDLQKLSVSTMTILWRRKWVHCTAPIQCLPGWKPWWFNSE